MYSSRSRIPYSGLFSKKKFRTIATILNFEELNSAQRHDFENKFSFLLWSNKSFVEFIFEDNVLNEIFENKFPLKITRYTVIKAHAHAIIL